MSRKLTSLACMLAIGLLCSVQVAPTRAAVISGTTSTVTSSADLDLNNIIYAVNLGDTATTTDQIVGGVTFSRSGDLPAGVTLNGSSTLGPAAGFEANLDGGGSGEDALEAVLNTLTFAAASSPTLPLITLDTDNGAEYRLQLLIYDAGYSSGRQFDILVDGSLVVEDEALGLGNVMGTSNTFGRLYTLDFTADSDETQVTFGFGAAVGIDPNPVVSGITLAIVPEPASMALCLFGMVATSLVRRRS